MPGLLYTSSSFAVLERALLTALQSLKQSDPLAAVWVVVPTNRLQQHLARRLAAVSGGHFNLRFLPLLDLAREIVEVDLWRRGWSALPKRGAVELLRSLIDASSPSFGAVHDGPRFLDALAATVDDLIDANIDPSELARASTRPARGGARKIAEVADLTARYRDAMHAAGFFDRLDVLGLAADALAGGTPLPVSELFVYGFYDLTPLQRRLLDAALTGRTALVFFPWSAQRSFDYATRTRSWFLSLGLRSEVLQDDVGESDLGRAQCGLFEGEGQGRDEGQLSLFGGAKPMEPAVTSSDGGEADGTLWVVSAPGEAREAREVVRAVLRLVRDRSCRFSDIGVLLRRREPYVRLLAETFTRMGIPFFLEGGLPLAERRAGQALMSMLRILQRDFARADVVEFFSTAPLSRKDLSVPASAWERLSIQAGIVKGEEEWRPRLSRLRARHASSGEGEEGGNRGRLVQRLDSFIAFLDELFARLGRIPEVGSWREMCDATLRCFRRYVRGEEAEAVAAAIAELAGLDTVGGQIDRSRFADAVAGILQAEATACGRFGEGVFIGEVLQSRGLSFRAVVIPGAVEKVIPRPLSQDPILLDADRQRINEVLRAEMPLKLESGEEERLLFSLMLRAAGEAAVLTFPRLDATTARERVPSWYLLEVMAAVGGARPTFADLAKWDRLERVDLSQLAPADTSDALDEEEYDLCAVQRAIGNGDPSGIVPLLGATPLLRRAALAHHRRWGVDRFSAFDGRLASDECRVVLRRCFSPAAIPVAGTSLQLYARCPFGYFLRHILGLRETEIPEEVEELSGRDRGNLVHRILQDFFERALARGWLPLRDASMDQLRGLLDEAIQRCCAEFEQDGMTGSSLLWQRARRHLTEDLVALVETERTSKDDFRPRSFELGFGDERVGQAAVRVRLPDGRDVALWGRIDRVDVDPENRGRITDYKTGKNVADFEKELPAGEILQLLVYRHAMRQLEPRIDWEEARLLAVRRGEKVRPSVLPDDVDGDLPPMLAAITAGIESGVFPAGGPWCSFCSFPNACAPTRALYPLKEGDESLDVVRTLHQKDPK